MLRLIMPGRFYRCWFSALLVVVAAGSEALAQGVRADRAAQGYLYVEPYVARFECLIRLEEMLSLLGEPGASMLPADSQPRIIEKVRVLAANWLRLKLDDVPSTSLRLSDVTVLKGVPGRTERMVKGELMLVEQSMIGLSWEQDFGDIPERIELEWNGFTAALPSLPVTAIANSQSQTWTLTQISPTATWLNQGRINLRPALVEVPALPPPDMLYVPFGSVLWLILCAFFLSHQRRSGRKVPGRMFITWTSLLLGAAVLWRVLAFEMVSPWSQSKPVAPDQAERILQALLKNTYRAFDQRQEPVVYDVLERSVHGPLLQKLYLQISQSLALDAEDSVRIHVSDLSMQVDGVRSLRGRPGFVVDGKWNTFGTVEHWGHPHQRVNSYTAQLTVEPVGQAWKLTDVVVKEQKRL